MNFWHLLSILSIYITKLKHCVVMASDLANGSHHEAEAIAQGNDFLPS